MQLDIYAFDAGAIDGAGFYGSMESQRFSRQFPRGFGPLAKKAGEIGCRLGLWGGPDGFGKTANDARKRKEMMISLCRDFNFALFKMDAVCGQLRKDKRKHFVEMMSGCRKYSPDLILLNHRLDLGEGLAHATTFLWEGAETYIDVHMCNGVTAPHNRAVALTRGLVLGLKRLAEDHGVCLSSCLDYWEDDLVLQAFNRCLILSPEIYGNPWLLRDDEYSRLARIYNLHRRYRDILVEGIELPEKRFGKFAVSRGNGKTRLITLRNLSWEKVSMSIPLDGTIGLKTHDRKVHVRRLHPHERIIGEFRTGASIDIDVLPFRSCLLLATTDEVAEFGVRGCDYDVERDTPGKDVVIQVLGLPGTTATIALTRIDDGEALIDGKQSKELSAGRAVRVKFGGKKLTKAWHRKLGDLRPVAVPQDARSLYETTCFAADSNAMEVRELVRSGPTAIPQVRAAREAFFNQTILKQRDLWDRNLFDNDSKTAFAVGRRWAQQCVAGGCFRLDFGKVVKIDRIELAIEDEHDLQPYKSQECIWGEVSADLKSWTRIQFWCDKGITANLPADMPIRYITLTPTPDRVREVRGFYRGRRLERSLWRASNLLAGYAMLPARRAWQLKFRLEEAAVGSYLAIAINGVHGPEQAYAAIRAGDIYAGAPRRSPSYPSNTWECTMGKSSDRNYTYYIPVTGWMIGKKLEAVVMQHAIKKSIWDQGEMPPGSPNAICPELWLTAYPIPFVKKKIVIKRS